MSSASPRTKTIEVSDSGEPEDVTQRKSLGRALSLTNWPNWLLALTSFILVFVVWRIAIAVLSIPAYVLPTPTDVGQEIFESRSLLFRHSLVTLNEVLVGFAASLMIGFPLAIAIAFSRILDRLIYPLLVAGQAVPKVAVAPIMVLWFGFGFKSNVAVAASIAVFPVVVNTALGFKSIDPDLIRLGRSMGATQVRLLRKIRIPNALPNIFVGLKLGITFAVIGAVVGEFIAGSAGLGYLIQLATGQLRTVLAFASIAVLSALGIALFYIVEAIERVSVRWHESQEFTGI